MIFRYSYLLSLYMTTIDNSSVVFFTKHILHLQPMKRDDLHLISLKRRYTICLPDLQRPHFLLFKCATTQFMLWVYWINGQNIKSTIDLSLLQGCRAAPGPLVDKSTSLIHTHSLGTLGSLCPHSWSPGDEL